ncbi:MAG TPA: AmmeMemoRadiSam system protein A [Thermoanaerobaculia bacterium]|nr:AmmeMemoRadiSam system protein A [Thermoanaerobaculia bacterium]
MPDHRGSTLLAIARATLERSLLARDGDVAIGTPVEAWLLDHGATFVSLHQRTRLRGCVGSLEAMRPLHEDVQRNALAAAFEDSRFPPVAADELDGLSIEVTLLGARELLPCRSERDALALLRPGIDGLLLSYGQRRATFLPQVWENLAEAPLFLAALKEKAGLDRDFWHPSIVLERYAARSWSEPES